MFQCVKELLLSYKKEVERFIERLEVGKLYGVGFVNVMGKPTGGDKALVLENKEMGLRDMGQMDVEVYGADRSNKPKGVGVLQSMVDGDYLMFSSKAKVMVVSQARSWLRLQEEVDPLDEAVY
jgi:hypothetical protein